MKEFLTNLPNAELRRNIEGRLSHKDADQRVKEKNVR